MKLEDEIENLKRRLLINVSADNLASYSPEEQRKLLEGIKMVPEEKMLQKAQYLFNILLPKIEKSSGRESENYKFYRELIDMLVWAIFLVDRYKNIESLWRKERMLRQFYQDHADYCEKELQKFQTAEDLFLTSGIDAYAKGILQKAEQFFEQSKKTGTT